VEEGVTTGPKMPATIDEYIAEFPPDVQVVLHEVRATIRKAAPAAREKISYRIPTFTLNGRYLVYFAGYSSHITIYPAPLQHAELADELAPYASGKGTVRFPLDRPVRWTSTRRS
jgi:uncharacterized protein YdhG (YjbR/CyaY superfamily)